MILSIVSFYSSIKGQGQEIWAIN